MRQTCISSSKRPPTGREQNTSSTVLPIRLTYTMVTESAYGNLHLPRKTRSALPNPSSAVARSAAAQNHASHQLTEQVETLFAALLRSQRGDYLASTRVLRRPNTNGGVANYWPPLRYQRHRALLPELQHRREYRRPRDTVS